MAHVKGGLQISDLVEEMLPSNSRGSGIQASSDKPVLTGEQMTSFRLRLLQCRSRKIRKDGLTDVDNLSITRSFRPVHSS